VTVATNLGTLYSERRQADYELKTTRPENVVQAGALVTLAERAVELVEAVRGDVTLWGAIASAVLLYVNTSKPAGLRRT
jgi:hypothetical protein